ncbi:MAG: hypothetical protein IIU63_04885, partial [Clostridia bacterium]|nr:hypothetical protein [Clostridia bacterium]
MKTCKYPASALLALIMLVGTFATAIPTYAADDARTYAGAPITEHEGGYDYDFAKRTLSTYTYDFSVERVNAYIGDPALALGNRASARIVDGALTTTDGKTFAFGSALCLGDDYGLEQGYLSFDLSLTGGTVYLGVRNSQKAVSHKERGIWFAFDTSGTLRIFEPECGLEATLPLDADLSKTTVTLHEALDTIALYADEQLIAMVSYAPSGYLAFADAHGKVLAQTDACKLYQTGYFTLELCDIDGYVDNVRFTNVQQTWEIPTADTLRKIDYSTWTATDALDRTTADNTVAGAPNEQRYVG